MNDASGELKVCIIALDCLEYDLVEKWDLKNLKQREYGKVEVPIDEGVGEPRSPSIWASFLTGLKKEKDFKYRSKFIKFLNKIKDKGDYSFPSPAIIRFFSKFFSLVKVLPELEDKTFLDEIESKKVNVPYYDFSKEKSGETWLKFIKGELTSKEFKNELEKEFGNVKDEIIDSIKSTSNQLLMGYTSFLDSIQHHFYMDMDYLEEKYRETDRFVGKIKDLIGDEVLIIIVSDHGADFEGGHSNHGFYSSNQALDLNEPEITDFYELVMERFNLPGRADKEKVEEKLQELGYI